MALSRNARRAVNKKRQERKQLRITKAQEAIVTDAKRALVRRNLDAPKERNFYPKSCLANLAGQSHRVYVCSNRQRFDMTGADKVRTVEKD